MCIPLTPSSPAEAAARGAGADTPALRALAEGVAESLRRTGCCLVRDSRVQAADNERFLDMMERYFGQPWDTKLADTRPQLHYQVRLPSHWECCNQTAKTSMAHS